MLENFFNMGLRTRPHRHRNQINNQRNRLCQRVKCNNVSMKLKRVNRYVDLIRPPPLFQLEPPPDPLEFLSLQGNLYTLDTSRITCFNEFNMKNFNTHNFINNNKHRRPEESLVRYNISSSIKESLFKRINNSVINEQNSINRHHNFSRDGFIPTTSPSPAFFPRTSPVAANTAEFNNENSILNFLLLFGISMMTVIFAFIIFYVCLTRRKNLTNKKRKNRKSQESSDTSSDQVQSSTMSQSSYSTTNNNNNNSFIARSYPNNQDQPDQSQHLLAHEPTEFSQFIPNLLLTGNLSHQQHQQLLQQQQQTPHDFMNPINSNQVPLSNSFLAYDWLSLPHNNNNNGLILNNHLLNNNLIKPAYPTMNENLKKAKKSSKKSSKKGSPKNNLIPQVDACGCSTLSTRATTETSSSNSSTSTPSGSTKLTQQSTDLSHLVPSAPNHQIQTFDTNNHYQKLFLKNNSFRQGENLLQQQYHLRQQQNNNNNSQNSPYMPNKVALLCNTDSNMPQLIKVMDIKELNDYVQLMSLDAQNRQLGIDHYENFYTDSMNTDKKEYNLFPTPQQQEPATDEVYELIDDIVHFNSADAQQNLKPGSQASSTLLKRKYPKTNPNYIQSSNILNSSLQNKS